MLDPWLYRDVIAASAQGFCVMEVLFDERDRAVDYRFLEVNPVFEELTGLVAPVGRTALELVPGLEYHWIERYGQVAQTGVASHFVLGSDAMGRCFEVYASRVGPPDRRLVALLFNDVTAHLHEREERQRAEHALRASEQRFRLLADTAPAMLWVTERDGSCTFLSRGWMRFTGQSEAEGLGFGWLEAVFPGDREHAREVFTAANAARRPFEMEHRLRDSSGGYRWVIDAGRPRFDDNGQFEGFVGSVIDIHDRKTAEHRLDLAVTSGGVGLWYCDLPFDTLIWNRQVKAHFGLPADAHVTIDTFFAHLHPDDREPTGAAIEAAIANHTVFDTQYRTIGLDGGMRWIRAVGRAMYEGDRAIRFDGVTVDVSELVALRESAEAANLAKDEFLAMLGHELRNPLAPILTALQLLKLRGVEAGDRERAIIERQVRHLVRLVDDLLDVSRITRGRVELRRERVELADVVARAVELTSPLLEQQRHALEVDVPRGLVVDGDAGRLAQVVANLLTNAAKYTEAGGAVAVQAAAVGDDVVLRVRDTGVGIDEAMLTHIFDRFVQERQTLARSQGGLGLGLAIVRSLVELHGGAVSAESAGLGHGATFTIRLPLMARHEAHAGGMAAEADADAAPGPAAPRLGRRVLVVDDNHDAAVMLGMLVRELGYDTRVVYDGPSALLEAEVFEPHLALVDLGLPVMDGFEVAARFTGHPRLRATRLVAVTGYGQDRDRESSARAGFVMHLVKPVDAEQLRLALAGAAASADAPPSVGQVS